MSHLELCTSRKILFSIDFSHWGGLGVQWSAREGTTTLTGYAPDITYTDTDIRDLSRAPMMVSSFIWRDSIIPQSAIF